MTATLAAAMFAAVLSADAPSQDEALVRAQVNAYLGASDTTPESWRQLGAPAVPFLLKVIDDRDASPPRRVKAVSALTIIGTRSDGRRLLELARSEREPSVLRVTALRSGVKLVPKADAMAQLKSLLKGARATQVRVVAAESMIRLSKHNGCAAVRAQAGKEKPKDQKRFQRLLRRCPPPPEAPQAAAPAAPAKQTGKAEPAAPAAPAEPAGEAK